MRKSLFLMAAIWASGNVWAGEIGAVSGVVGSPTIAGSVARMDTKIGDGDEIITGPGEAIALCLDSKVVIKLDAKTAIKVRELSDKTDIQLEHGKARVYVAKRDGSRPVVMTDPKAAVTAHGTVFLGDFDDQTGNSSYSADESSISVNSGGQTTNVTQGQQANYSVGQLLGLGASSGGTGGTMGTLDSNGRQDAAVMQQTQAANVAAFSVLNVGKTSNITPVETNAQGTNSNTNNGTGTNENGQNPAGGTQTQSTDQAAPPLPSYNVGQLNTGAGTTPIPAGTVQNQTVMNLVQSGQIPGVTPTPTTVTSTGGFSDVAARLTTAGTLDFSIRDNGIPDGDTVNLTVVNNGNTVLTQQNVVLTSAAQKFSAPASVGSVDVHVVSVSDGQVPPNTGQVTVSNVTSGKQTQSYGINAGDEAILHVAAAAAGGPAGGPRPHTKLRR